MTRNAYSKLAAIGLLLLLIAGSWIVVVEPYIDLWQERVAQAERQQRKLNTLNRLIEDQDHYAQQFQAVSESRSLKQLFLGDKLGALADARLQGIVKQAVADNGGKLLQAVIVKHGGKPSNRADGESGADKTVTIKVLMQGSIESIYGMLQSLDNSRPLITVDNLQIVHQKSRAPVPEQVSATSYKASYDATAYVL